MKVISISKPLYIFKIIIAGDSGVGKTTLIRRFADGRFIPSKRSTIGVDYFLKNVTITYPSFESIIALQIWDLAGEEKYKSVLPIYLPGTHGIIPVYSEDIKCSLYYLTEFLNVINLNKKENIPMILIKAKNDLYPIQEESETVKNILERRNIGNYFITSAKTGQNINEVFKKITEFILKSYSLI